MPLSKIQNLGPIGIARKLAYHGALNCVSRMAPEFLLGVLMVNDWC